jgi:hypothetical protein
MNRLSAFCVAIGASLAIVACEQAPSTVSPSTPPALDAKIPRTPSFTFSKVPAPVTTVAVTSPSVGLETIVFRMDATQAAGIVVKQFGFMISGSLQAGSVGNYQLVYYAQGLTKPGTVIGTNDGANWVAPGGDASSFIRFTLTAPITIPNGNSFTGYFALRADVTGAGGFFFYPRVQTCTVNDGSGDKDVLWFAGDLPVQGNTYSVK